MFRLLPRGLRREAGASLSKLPAEVTAEVDGDGEDRSILWQRGRSQSLYVRSYLGCLKLRIWRDEGKGWLRLLRIDGQGIGRTMKAQAHEASTC